MKTLDEFKAAYNSPFLLERWAVIALITEAENTLSSEEYNQFYKWLDRKRFCIISLKDEPMRVFEANEMNDIFNYLNQHRQDVEDLQIYDLETDDGVDADEFIQAWDNGENIIDLTCFPY